MGSTSQLDARALLFGIARHVLANCRRRATRQAAAEWEPAAEAPSAEDERVTAEEEDARTEMVRGAIGAIPAEFRDVFVSYEVEGHSVKATAARLGIPVNTGYNRLRLARKHFREHLLRERAKVR